MERGLACIMDIQELLDQEATLSNTGKGKSQERMEIHTLIRLQRFQPAPMCFGHDDCGTDRLSMCPWRMDCGS